MDRNARKARQPGAGAGHDNSVLQPQSATLSVSATDTLESVLERVRASDADELVLEVDERSPLLISLQHLHQLEETAQERGIQVAIASANSKLVNAARVFGIDVIDERAVAAPPPPIDEAFAPAPDLEGEGPRESIGPHRNGAAVREGDPVVDGEQADDARWTGWGGRGPADQPTDPPDGEPALLAASPHLDPYGQPYDEAPDEDDEPAEDDDGEDEGPPRRFGERIIRPLGRRRRAATPRPAATWDADGDDGWDGDPHLDESDDEFSPDEPRRGLLPGLGAFLADVRARVASLRDPGSTIEAEEGDGEDDDFVDEADADDDGWDALHEPPVAPRAAAGATVLSPARARPRDVDRRDPIGDPDAADADGWAEPEPVDDPDDAWGDEPRRTRRRTANLLGYVLLAGLLATAIGAVGLYWLLAGATVTLTARTGSVGADFNVVVGEIDPNTPQGQPTTERIVSPARRVTVPVSTTATVPATGARLEPDVTAGGPVTMLNASTDPVTVPKGTQLAALDGRVYVTLEGATVPAADPFDAAVFGTVVVKVAATTPGSAGNADAGVLRGRLPSGIYYNNRSAPIAGGSDRKISVIARNDLAAAQAAAEDAARTKGQAALAAALPDGHTILRDTAGVGNFKVEFNAAEGADGDAVTATVAAEATALIYAQADVDARARAEAERRLAAGVKSGEALVPGTARVDAPQLVEEQPGLRTYHVAGQAQTRAAIGGERERLAGRLAGKDDDDARAVLQTVPGVSSYAITYAPTWFPQRMPWRASHIDIRIADR